MSATELSTQSADNNLAKMRAEEARKARASYSARANTDFYGVVGWLAGVVATFFISIQ
jgi:hypothetical protein